MTDLRENPAYGTYEESLSLVSDDSICDTRMTRRFFSESNLRYMNSRAHYYLGLPREETLRTDELVDATFFKLCENAKKDRVLDKCDEDFQIYENYIMKAVYQTDANSKDDRGTGIGYSRHWDPLEVNYDTGDGEESFDRTNPIQLVKGDGLDDVLCDMTSLVQDCKGCYCRQGISYVVVISTMCLFREYLTKGLDTSAGIAQVSQLMQSLFGMSETETHSIYEQIRQDSNLNSLVSAGFKEPMALIEEVKKSVRCGTFIDNLERLIHTQCS